jgi:hypothetical protein
MIRPILGTNGLRTCPECGLAFHGMDAFGQHRNQGICLSSTGLQSAGLRKIKGTWELAPVTAGTA